MRAFRHLLLTDAHVPGLSRRRTGKDLVVVAVAVDLYVYDGDRQLRWGTVAPPWLIPVLAPLVYTTLMLRWRAPEKVFAGQWTHALAGLVLPGYAPFAGLLVASHAVACSVSRRGSTVALFMGFAALSINNRLPEPATTGDAPTTAPRTLVEAVLTDLFATLLGAPAVGVEDGFFDVGGNSLQAMRLVAALRSDLAVDLDVSKQRIAPRTRP